MKPIFIPVKQNIKAHTHADNDTYLAMYQQSIKDPEGFWSEHGKIVDWIKPFTKVKHTSFDPGHIDIRWFERWHVKTFLPTVLIAIWRPVATKSRSFGKAMTQLKTKP